MATVTAEPDADGMQELEPAGSLAPQARSAGNSASAKAAAVRSSMRQLLAAKKAGVVSTKGTGGGGGGGGAGVRETVVEHKRSDVGDVESSPETSALAAQEEDDQSADPWPEMPLHATHIGIEDGQRRAEELRRRGDFAGAAKMWDKTLFVAHRCPSMSATEVVGLASKACSDLVQLEEWSKVSVISSRGLEAGRDFGAAPAIVHLLCARAKARAELGYPDAARSDMAEAVTRELNSLDDGMDGVQEEARQLEIRLRELEAERKQHAATEETAKAAASTSKLHAAAAAAATSSSSSSSGVGVDRALPSKPAQAMPASKATATAALPVSGDSRDQAAFRNQEFFSRMERDYEDMCARDGWDDIIRIQEELKGAPLPRSFQGIPQDSDYFKVHVPSGAFKREMRATNLSEEALAAYRLPPPKPKRNLDELRRVEAATREAIEREKAARAAREPIRCRSDVVTIDDLEEECEEDESGKSGNDGQFGELDDMRIHSLQDEGQDAPHIPEEAQQAIAALKEFERIGRENDEKLAKWQARFGC